MGADVVGVAVPAERVVGDDDLRLGLVDQLGELRGLLVGRTAGERPRVRRRRRARHARIAPPADAAQKTVPGHPQRGARGLQLGDAVTAQLVRGPGAQPGELGQAGHDLTLLTERAGHHGHLGAFGGVSCDRGAGGDALVVGMGVDEEQPARYRGDHGLSVIPVLRPSSGTPSVILARVATAASRSSVPPRRASW